MNIKIKSQAECMRESAVNKLLRVCYISAPPGVPPKNKRRDMTTSFHKMGSHSDSLRGYQRALSGTIDAYVMPSDETHTATETNDL